MKFASQAVQTVDEEIAVESPKPLFKGSVELIHHIFPNLSLLEKFVLSTVLEDEHIEKLADDDYPTYFSQTQMDEGVGQYIGYLKHREKWEQRKLDEKKTKKIRAVPCFHDRLPV